MKLMRRSKILGMAITERSVTVAELSFAHQPATIVRTAELALGPELTLDDPTTLGQRLSHFLREKGFSASRAVVGVPAKWLMAREKEIPPASAELAASTLKIQAERDFGAETKDLVLDYAGEPNERLGQRVLLVAMLRERLDRVVQAVEQSGLTVLAVTSSTLALAAALGGASSLQPAGGQRNNRSAEADPAKTPRDGEKRQGLLLALSGDAAELTMTGEGGLPLLRHLPVPMSSEHLANGKSEATVASLGSELRRAVALLPKASEGRAMWLWDGLGLSSQAVETLTQRAGFPVQSAPELRDVKTNGDTHHNGQEALVPRLQRFGPAIALALTPEHPAIDMLHPRLAEKKKQRISRQTIWGTAIALAVVLAGAYLVWDVQHKEKVLADLQTKLKGVGTDVATAMARTGKVSVARGWFPEKRPSYLSCLREITQAFPTEGSIWATSFTLKETPQGFKGVLSGRATDQGPIRDVLGKLQNNKKFADVKNGPMREAGGKSKDWTFSISFTFKALE